MEPKSCSKSRTRKIVIGYMTYKRNSTLCVKDHSRSLKTTTDRVTRRGGEPLNRRGAISSAARQRPIATPVSRSFTGPRIYMPSSTMHDLTHPWRPSRVNVSRHQQLDTRDSRSVHRPIDHRLPEKQPRFDNTINTCKLYDRRHGSKNSTSMCNREHTHKFRPNTNQWNFTFSKKI